MKEGSKIGTWLQQIRAPFLILPVFLVLIGVAAAKNDGYTQWLHAALLIIGVTLSHISANLFNEVSDYKTKIDENTTPTPFSGGSGMMQAGKIETRRAIGQPMLHGCNSWVLSELCLCRGNDSIETKLIQRRFHKEP